MPLLCRFRSKPVSYSQPAFSSAQRSSSARRFFALPCCALLGGWGRQPNHAGFCCCAEHLERCPITPGAHHYTMPIIQGLICISGHQSQGRRRCFGDGKRPTVGCERGVFGQEGKQEGTKVWMSTGEIRRLVIPILHDPERAPL